MAVPKVFTSEIPVFMPIEYVDIPPMRLDSNVVYYMESDMAMGMEAKAEAESGWQFNRKFWLEFWLENHLSFGLRFPTVIGARMSHWKWTETKLQQSRARSGHQISRCLVSLNFLCDILAPITVH